MIRPQPKPPSNRDRHALGSGNVREATRKPPSTRRTNVERRICLKAAGVSLALPMLESMTPANGAPLDEVPHRMVLICTTLGLHGPALWPQTAGKNYESTEYLDVLSEHRKEMTLFSGLCHESQSGRRPHDSEATFLTAARNPGFAGFRNSISVDQVAAEKIGSQTRFPSIVLGSNNLASQSYTRNGVMIPARTRPSRLFSDLFLNGTPEEVRLQKQKLQNGRSILDQLRSEMTRVSKRSSSNDVRLLEEYFDAVRQTEQSISVAEGWLQKPKPAVSEEPPTDVKNRADLIGRVRGLMDLIPLILQTDSSRIITVMIQDHNVVPQIAGVAGNHHNLSHHGQDPAKILQLKTVETELLQCFSQLLNRMKSKREKGHSLLNSTSVLFGSNMGNANMHNTRNLPILLAGGDYRHGSFRSLSKGTPLSNLFLTLLRKMGLSADTFGQSSGELDV